MTRLLIVVVLLAVSTLPVSAFVEWTLFEWSEGMGNPVEYGPKRIFYTLSDDGLLSLNATAVRTVGNSSATCWQFGNYGNWGVCGTIMNEIWSPDPYATFVQTGNSGFIRWKPDTPCDYSTNLYLGAKFEGCEAASLTQYALDTPIGNVEANIAIMKYCPVRPLSYFCLYDPKSKCIPICPPSCPVIPEVNSLLLALPALPTLLLIRRAKST